MSGFAARSALQRHTPSNPCGICGGHSGLGRGRGIRCAGFNLDAVIYCTREEFAGRLSLDVTCSPAAYRHRLTRDCRCGIAHLGRPRLILRDRVDANETLVYPGSAERDAAYSRVLELLTLRPEAATNLARRGLRREEAVEAGLRSLPLRGTEHQSLMTIMKAEFGERFLLTCPGFHDKNGRVGMMTASGDRDGYLVPYKDEDRRITGWQAKILGAKYLTPAGMKVAYTYAIAGRGRPGADLYITEGGLKAIVASALRGVWCLGLIGQALQPSHVSVVIRLAPGRVIVALDREANANTDRARQHWLTAFADAGLATYEAVWDGAT